MIPRKKRSRYAEQARQLSLAQGLAFNPNDWESIWSLLDSNEAAAKHPCIYAIADKLAGLVKFGKSVSPGQRLAGLQTANGSRLELWAFCPETEGLTEKSVHQEMKAHRVGGEWFLLNQATREVIQRIRRCAGVPVSQPVGNA